MSFGLEIKNAAGFTVLGPEDYLLRIELEFLGGQFGSVYVPGFNPAYGTVIFRPVDIRAKFFWSFDFGIEYISWVSSFPSNVNIIIIKGN
jgi:hypothetical protein